jgi:thiol-disulfide isomerase/thioredoxin
MPFSTRSSTVRRVSARGRVRGQGHSRVRWSRICAVSAGLVLVAGCGNSGNRTSVTAAETPGTTVFPAAERRPLAELSGETLAGQSLNLGDVAGSGVVVINVWASWCTSCREESAALAAVAGELRGQQVSFVGVDEQDQAPAARRFVAETRTTYPQLSDPQGLLLDKLSVLPQSGIPSTLLLDRRGLVAARVIGPVTQPQLRRLIGSLQRES